MRSCLILEFGFWEITLVFLGLSHCLRVLLSGLKIWGCPCGRCCWHERSDYAGWEPYSSCLQMLLDGRLGGLWRESYSGPKSSYDKEYCLLRAYDCTDIDSVWPMRSELRPRNCWILTGLGPYQRAIGCSSPHQMLCLGYSQHLYSHDFPNSVSPPLCLLQSHSWSFVDNGFDDCDATRFCWFYFCMLMNLFCSALHFDYGLPCCFLNFVILSRWSWSHNCLGLMPPCSCPFELVLSRWCVAVLASISGEAWLQRRCYWSSCRYFHWHEVISKSPTHVSHTSSCRCSSASFWNTADKYL